MPAGIKTVIYPVKDLEQAKKVFGSLLGGEPVMDEPYYVQYAADGLEVGLDPNGHSKGMTGPVTYWQVSDIKASVEGLVGAGGTIQQDVNDVGGGRLIATVQDADGNVIGLVQP